jgi:hypothetical protein
MFIMSFTPATRGWSTDKFPTKASTTYAVGDFIYNDETDNVPVTTSSQNNLIGIAKEAKASSSTTTSISVLCPNSTNSKFKATSGTGTLTKAMEGDQFDFATASTIAQGTSTYDVCTLVQFIDASTGIFKLNVLHGKD